jgi:mannitol-1-phosphate/altronate dehydrogenase
MTKEELKEQLKTSYRKGMRHMAKALKDYDRTDGAWTDYFEHTVDKVLQREQVDFEENCTLVDQLTKAKEIILMLYNAGRDVLMCRNEEKAYDNLSKAVNDKSIEQFISEVKK